MKQSIQWIAAMIMAASSGLALAGPGCGDCSYMLKTARIEPVREIIVQRSLCTVQQPLIIKEESKCLMGSPSRLTWNDAATPFHALGNVAAAPFRMVGSGIAWTGRQFSGPSEVIESQPAYVGERFTTITKVSKKTTHHKKHHMLYKKVTYSSSPALLPVGERFTTVKVIRSKPLLEPVGEKITTVRVIRNQPLLMPVGERFTTVRVIRSQPLLMPVGERFTTVKVIRTQPLLMPVGEKITTIRTLKLRPVLEPVGERTTIIRTSRVFVKPLSSCGCSYNPYR